MTKNLPPFYSEIHAASKKAQFDMPSTKKTGALLRGLAASKPNGFFLELGTGTGLALTWILDGMNAQAKIISVENNPKWLNIAHSFFDSNPQVTLIEKDAESWIEQLKEANFDLVFADTWAGKFTHLEPVLDRINRGGFYVIDDLNPKSNWPEGHLKKVQLLKKKLRKRIDFIEVRLNWDSGITIMIKK